MKGKLLLIMASILLFIMSCDKKEQIHSLTIDQDTKQIVFFSDEEEYEQEVSYYNAIIELKRDYPEEIKNMKILTASETKDYFNIFHVEQCPALLVYYKDEVIIKVKGKATTEQIVKPVSGVLSETY